MSGIFFFFKYKLRTYLRRTFIYAFSILQTYTLPQNIKQLTTARDFRQKSGANKASKSLRVA